jgi:transcriptional regulator with XRE-family HTH domain
MTQRELAQRSGVSLDTISRLERDKHRPHVNTLYLLAKALDVPVERLL